MEFVLAPFGLFFLCIPLFLFAISLALVVFSIWMFIDCITRDDNKFGDMIKENAKLIWVLIILFTGSIGSIIYYFMVYKKVAK